MGLKSGYLKEYFQGVAAKKLSNVELVSANSNQHEFNGVTALKSIFGSNYCKFAADFLYINDDDSYRDEGYVTWYDSRKNHPTRSEYRLYYSTSTVMKKAQEGDSIFVCLKQDETILCIIAGHNTSITNQLYWLFNLEEAGEKNFVPNTELNTNSENLEFAVRTILEQIGIEYRDDEQELLENVIEKFNGVFPKTALFSEYARSLVHNVDPIQSPDKALVQWVDQEEKMFFSLEKYIISERLKKGFVGDKGIDTDAFIGFALSVINRRKSRAGYSLENHLSCLFDENGVHYSHAPVTENKSKPDFLFPNIEFYRESSFPENKLTILGVKSTCKDRWRQVLAEADRISRKHLLTLEPAISTYQTDEMISKSLQLVVPEPIQKTYTCGQQKWLFSVRDFIAEVKEKQEWAKLKYGRFF